MIIIVIGSPNKNFITRISRIFFADEILIVFAFETGFDEKKSIKSLHVRDLQIDEKHDDKNIQKINKNSRNRNNNNNKNNKNNNTKIQLNTMKYNKI